MIAAAWPYLCATLCGGLVALWIHTRVRGFLPEDPPGPGRKRHARPTPMLGALPAGVAALACALSGTPGIAVSVLVAGVVGLIDDVVKSKGLGGLDWRAKALGLLASAVLAALAIGGFASLDDTAPFGRAALLVALLFCLINAFNFLDNQDGVSTALGGVALSWLALRDHDPLAAGLAAAWLGFLPLNWPRARAFLGDCGAYALGTCVSALALRPLATDDGLGIGAALAPVAVPALDFLQVLCVRLVLGYAPWKGDRRHVTHLLLAAGLPRLGLVPVLVLAATAMIAVAR